MEKERVEKPVTVLKPVTTEVPRYEEHKVFLAGFAACRC